MRGGSQKGAPADGKAEGGGRLKTEGQRAQAAVELAGATDDFVHQLSRTLAQANRFLAAALAERGFSGIAPSHGSILNVLFRRESLSMQDLARSIDRDPSTVTALVKKLAAEGYVRLEKGSEDRRVTVVSLTDEGRAIQREFAAISAELRAVQNAGIDAASLEAARRTLAAMQENFARVLAVEKDGKATRGPMGKGTVGKKEVSR